MEILSRQEARNRGLKRFFTGEPCKSGHIDERMTSSGACVLCKRRNEIGRYAKDPEKGLERKKAWRKVNPASEARAKAKYARLHREKVRADFAAWAAKNKDKIAEYGRKYRASTPLEKHAKKLRDWARANPDKVKAARARVPSEVKRSYTANYRARKRAAGGSWTAKDVEALFVAQDGLCNFCRVSISERFDVDHVIPVSRGGSNWPENLQLLCPTCNKSKGAKTMEEWRGLAGATPANLYTVA